MKRKGNLDEEIERAWLSLGEMSRNRLRTLYLTAMQHVVWEERHLLSSRVIEIGTYRHDVAYADLREDVLWAAEQQQKVA